VAAARVCLLNPEKKTMYDPSLRQHLLPAQADSLDPGLAAVFQMRMASSSAIASGGRRKRSQPKPMAFIAAAALTVVAVGLAAVWPAIGHDSAPGDGGIAKAVDSATSATPANEASQKPPQPSKEETPIPAARAPKETSRADDPKAAPLLNPPEPEAVAQAKPQPEEDKGAKPASNDSPVEKTEPNEQRAPAKKLVPPSADEQKRLMAEIDEIYKPGEAKDQAAKAALGRKLLEDGRKSEANRAEQFVLLRRAGEIARDAGEAELMLEAVDAIADAGFNIQPCQVKSRLLKRLVEQGALGGASQHSAICASCVKFAEDAAAGGAVDEALDLLDTAKKSLARSIIQAQAAQRAAKAALARARTPADKTTQEKKAGEAQAELDAIKSAQSSLAECAKGLQQVRHEHEAILRAQERLKTAPDDPDACLAVGRWYCFHQGNWDGGLKLLAKGSDDALKSRAAEELASKPSKAADKVARGDAWWDLAEKATGRAKAAMRRRAGHWYQEAMPDLAPGLAKSKIEKRLAQAADEPAPEAKTEATRIHPPLAAAPFNEKTAKQHQARWAKYLHVPVVQTNSIGMKLVLIPPGEFQMGAPKEMIEEELRAHGGEAWYREHLPGEGPQHRVRITKAYWLGATQVTQEEYERVMASNPSKFQGDPKRPVEQVSWDDAVEFCRRLSELPGEKAAKRRYGLPTEAQWEYACRAGNAGRWCFSAQPNPFPLAVEEKLLGEYAWFADNNKTNGSTHPVAQKRPNAWGLYDMHGNVREWCADWYDGKYYAASPTDDPTGPITGSGRVGRGGLWYYFARDCRTTNRYGRPGSRYDFLGLRVSLVPADKSDK
jgi:formylglycine-generating enzyme required for sulfatase activity